MRTLRSCIFVIHFLFAILSCADALIFFNIQRYGEFPRMLAMRTEKLLNNATLYLNKEKFTDSLNRSVRSTDYVKTDNIIVQDNLELDKKTNNSKSNDVKGIPNANNKEFTFEKDKKNNEFRRLLLGRMDTNITSNQNVKIQDTHNNIKEIPMNNIDNKRSQRLILLRIHPSGRRYVKRIIYITGNNNLKPESDFGLLKDEPPYYGSQIHTIKRDQLNNLGGENTYADLDGLLEESQQNNQIGVQYDITHKELPFSSKISLQKQNGFNQEQRHLAYSKEGNPTKHVKLNYNDYPRLIHIISKITGGKYINPSMIPKHATTSYSPSTTNEELDYETIIKMFKEYKLNKQEPSELKKNKLYQILQNSNPKNVKFDVPIKTSKLDAYDDGVFPQDWSTYKENLKSDDILRLFEKIDNTRKNVDSVNEEITVGASVKNSTENEIVESHVVPATTVNPDPFYSKEVEVAYSLENPDNKQKSDLLIESNIESLTVLPIESNNLKTNQQAQYVFMENLTNNTSINAQNKDTPSQSSFVTIMDNESKTYRGYNVENAKARIKLPDDLKSSISKKLCIHANDKLLEAWDLIIQTLGLNTEVSNDEKRQKDITDTFVDIAMQRDFNELPLQAILQKFLKKISTEHVEYKEKQAVRANYYDLTLKTLNPGQKGGNSHLYDAQSQHRYNDDYKNKLLEYYNPVYGENGPSKTAAAKKSRAVKREMSIALANLLKQLSNDPYTLPDEIVPSLISYLTSHFNLSAPQKYCEFKKYLKLVEGSKQLVDDYYSNKPCGNGAVVANSDRVLSGHELPTFDSEELI